MKPPGSSSNAPSNEREVRAAAARLREAGASLRARPAEQTLESLGAWLDIWRDGSSIWRKRLEEALPEATGFSPQVVRAGLDHGLRDWTSAALRDVVETELRGVARAASPALVTGFPLTSVVLAGSIPMPNLLTLALPLLLHSPVLAKSASRDPVTPHLAVEALREVDPKLAQCLEVVAFPREDSACLEALLDADCIVTTGTDESVDAIGALISPGRRQVRYGHRLSVALVGREATDDDGLDRAARQLAFDIALWDQQGCLSPVAIFVEDPVFGAAAQLATALSRALEEIAERLPLGRVATADAARIAHERDAAEVRVAAAHEVVLHRGRTSTVVLEADATWRLAPLHRFVRVHPVRARGDLLRALRPIAPHLAAVAIAGFGKETGELARALGDLGASRICDPGLMQAPPLGWHHDGQPLLLPLARVSDLEVR